MRLFILLTMFTFLSLNLYAQADGKRPDKYFVPSSSSENVSTDLLDIDEDLNVVAYRDNPIKREKPPLLINKYRPKELFSLETSRSDIDNTSLFGLDSYALGFVKATLPIRETCTWTKSATYTAKSVEKEKRQFYTVLSNIVKEIPDGYSKAFYVGKSIDENFYLIVREMYKKNEILGRDITKYFPQKYSIDAFYCVENLDNEENYRNGSKVYLEVGFNERDVNKKLFTKSQGDFVSTDLVIYNEFNIQNSFPAGIAIAETSYGTVEKGRIFSREKVYAVKNSLYIYLRTINRDAYMYSEDMNGFEIELEDL